MSGDSDTNVHETKKVETNGDQQTGLSSAQVVDQPQRTSSPPGRNAVSGQREQFETPMPGQEQKGDLHGKLISDTPLGRTGNSGDVQNATIQQRLAQNFGTAETGMKMQIPGPDGKLQTVTANRNNNEIMVGDQRMEIKAAQNNRDLVLQPIDKDGKPTGEPVMAHVSQRANEQQEHSLRQDQFESRSQTALQNFERAQQTPQRQQEVQTTPQAQPQRQQEVQTGQQQQQQQQQQQEISGRTKELTPAQTGGSASGTSVEALPRNQGNPGGNNSMVAATLEHHGPIKTGGTEVQTPIATPAPTGGQHVEARGVQMTPSQGSGSEIKQPSGDNRQTTSISSVGGSPGADGGASGGVQHGNRFGRRDDDGNAQGWRNQDGGNWRQNWRNQDGNQDNQGRRNQGDDRSTSGMGNPTDKPSGGPIAKPLDTGSAPGAAGAAPGVRGALDGTGPGVGGAAIPGLGGILRGGDKDPKDPTGKDPTGAVLGGKDPMGRDMGGGGGKDPMGRDIGLGGKDPLGRDGGMRDGGLGGKQPIDASGLADSIRAGMRGGDQQQNPLLQLTKDPRFFDQLQQFRDGKLQDGKVADALKNLTPEQLDKLQALKNQQEAKDFGKSVREILDAKPAQAADKIASDKGIKADGADGRSAQDRLLDALKNKELDPKGGLKELNSLIKDVNKEGDGKNIALKELIQQQLKDGTLKLNEQQVKLLMDKLDGKLPDQAATNLMQKTAQLDTRAELKADAKAEGKIDAKTEGKAEAKVDVKEISKQDTTAGGKQDLASRTEAGKEVVTKDGKVDGKEPTAKDAKELGTKDGAKVDQRIDATTGEKKPEIKGEKEVDLRGGRTDATDKDAESKGKKPEKEEQDKRQDQRRMTDEEIAALAARKEKEEKERKEKEQLKEQDKQKEQERRQKYTVKKGDTLESIGAKQLRDAKLAGLIYEINKNVIPTVTQNGKKVLNLREKLVIMLPTPTDAQEYRGRMFKGGPQKFEYAQQYGSAEEELEARFGDSEESFRPESEDKDATADGGPLKSAERLAEEYTDAAVAAAKSRLTNIEKLLGGPDKTTDGKGRMKYLVRLGDTLRSIAIRHPALQDVGLWKLLAEVNNIELTAKDKGTSVGTLKRGSTLYMPTAQEIAEFRERTGIQPPKTTPIKADDSLVRMAKGQNVKVEKDEPDEVTKTVLMAAGLFGGAEPEPEPVVEAKVEDIAQAKKPVETIALAGSGQQIKRVPTGLPVIKRSGGSDGGSGDKQGKTPPAGLPMIKRAGSDIPRVKPDSPGIDASQPLVQLSETARLLNSEDGKTKLEVQRNNRWAPVVTYEIYDDVSLRHEFKLDGTKKTIRIDLPPSAVRELAQNDLSGNWKNYTERFLAGKAVSE